MFRRGFGLACALVLIGTTASTAHATTVEYDGTRLTVRLEQGAAGSPTLVVFADRAGDTFIQSGQEIRDLSGGRAGCTRVDASLRCSTGGQSVPVTMSGTTSSDLLRAVTSLEIPVRIEGGAGFDLISAGNGDDELLGGDGDDYLIGSLGADVVDGGTGIDTLAYNDSPTPVTIDRRQNQLPDGDTTTNVEGFEGSRRADRLIGGPGDDRLNGGLGDDVIESDGAGADDLRGSGGNDTVDYAGSPSGILVDLAANQGPGDDRLFELETVVGTPTRDVLRGDAMANRLVGGAGNDDLTGRDGDDVLEDSAGVLALDGGDGQDIASFAGRTTGFGLSTTQAGTSIEGLVGGSGADTLIGDDAVNVLHGGPGNDRLDAGGGADQLDGGLADDTLIGGAGADTLRGGGGQDFISYDDRSTPVTIDLGRRILPDGDTVDGIAFYSGSQGGDTLIGSAGDDTLYGGGGDDRIAGLGGNDLLHGGDGNDTARYDETTAAVTVDLGAGTARGAAGEDRLVIVEHAVGGTGDDVLSGTGVANTLTGGGGNDTLTGLGGDDRLLGGAGTNTLQGGNGGDTASFEDLATPVTYTLPADVEQLVGGSGSDTLTGNAGANAIGGGPGTGDDTLVGAGGADVLDGGGGPDTVSYAERATAVTVDLASLANTDGDQLANFDNITGGGGDDVLRGDTDNNVLTGGGGDDVLDPRTGNDRLRGGLGTDTVTYASRAGGVTARETGRVDAGTEFDLLDGGDVETFVGGAGPNQLAASGAVTKLVGGAANDAFTASAARPLTLDGGSGGTDAVSYAGVANGVAVRLDGAPGGRDTLVGVDDVTGGPGADTITGNAGANRLLGGAGDDVVTGAGGSDTLDGGAGTDTASFADRTTPVTATLGAAGLAGFETLVGGSGNDVLGGDAAANTIRGGAGDDTITAKDGVVDVVDCGDGTDDALDSDAEDTRTACERQPEVPKTPVQDGGGGQGGTQGSTQTGTTPTGTPPPAPAPPVVVGPRRQATVLAVRTVAGGRLRTVALRGLPAGARVRLTCRGGRGKGCPRTRSLTARGTTLALTRFAATRLRAGAVLRITVTAPGFAPRRFTLTGRRTGAPKRATADLPA